VALAVARGESNKEVARNLGITERTVKAHLSVVFEALGVRDRLQLSIHLNGIPQADPPKSSH
jgi:DNA-binding NarL/FixJ family response regulator